MNAYWPVILSGALVLYAIAVRRLRREVQPLRIELAEKGEWILSSNYLSNELKDHVLFLLDSAFGSRLVLLVSIVAIPIISILFLIYPKPLLDMDKHLHIKDAETKICFDRISTLHDRITLANHPFLFTIVMIYGSIIMLTCALLYIIFRGPSQWIARGNIMILIEKKIYRRRLAYSHS